MKRVTLFLFPLLLCLSGCGGADREWQANRDRDSAAFDSILATQRIDVIEFLSSSGLETKTNAVTGEAARKLVASFKTNRIAHTDETKQDLREVRLLSGTNEICWLRLGEDGTWSFRSYEFIVPQ